MQVDAPKLAPRATAPGGAWLWSRTAGGFVPVTAARFELHAIAETDPRFHALARGERVDVSAEAAVLLWAPDYVSAERIRHRGSVALALDTATSDRAPELWLDGKP